MHAILAIIVSLVIIVIIWTQVQICVYLVQILLNAWPVILQFIAYSVFKDTIKMALEDVLNAIQIVQCVQMVHIVLNVIMDFIFQLEYVVHAQ